MVNGSKVTVIVASPRVYFSVPWVDGMIVDNGHILFTSRSYSTSAPVMTAPALFGLTLILAVPTMEESVE